MTTGSSTPRHEAAASGLRLQRRPIVSSDVIGMKYGSLFDATQTMVAKIDDDTYQVQVVSWYDNEEQLHQPDGPHHQVLR